MTLFVRWDEDKFQLIEAKDKKQALDLLYNKAMRMRGISAAKKYLAKIRLSEIEEVKFYDGIAELDVSELLPE